MQACFKCVPSELWPPRRYHRLGRFMVMVVTVLGAFCLSAKAFWGAIQHFQNPKNPEPNYYQDTQKTHLNSGGSKISSRFFCESFHGSTEHF